MIEEPGHLLSCSDPCLHKLDCFYFKWGHCSAVHDDYNYNCQDLFYKGKEQRFDRRVENTKQREFIDSQKRIPSDMQKHIDDSFFELI